MDFCDRERQTIPPFEKKVIIVARLFGQKRTPTYLTSQIRARIGEDATPAQIRSAVASYIKAHPLCCQIVKPDHLGNQIWNGDYFLDDGGYGGAIAWGYVGDFFLFNDWPYHKGQFYKIDGPVSLNDVGLRDYPLPNGKFTVSSPGNVWMMNACGDLRSFNRG